MNKLFLSGIFMAFLAFNSNAFAYGGGGGGDTWSVGVDYNNMSVDTSTFNGAHETSPAPSTGSQINATSKFQSALLDVTYKSSTGFWLRAFGGMAFNGEINAGAYWNDATPVNVSETWNFTNAPTYGAAIGYEIFPDARIHLAPSFRWQQIKFTGNTGSVYNSTTGTTYNYDNSSTGGYTTVGNGVVPSTPNGGSISTSFNEAIFNAQVALAFDVISDGINTFTIGGGAEEAMTAINGSVVHSFIAFTEEEDYNFSSQTQLGYFAMMNLTLGPVTIGGEAHFTAEKFYIGRLAFNF